MEIVPIFADPNPENHLGLYAYRNANSTKDALTLVFESWNNRAHITKLCSQAKDRLASFYKLDIQNAVEQVLKEVYELESLLRPPEIWTEDYANHLEILFQDYHGTASNQKKLKCYQVLNGLLRIYAVRIDKGLFVVTSGGFKTTQTTQSEALHYHDQLKIAVRELKLIDELISAKQINKSQFTNQIIALR